MKIRKFSLRVSAAAIRVAERTGKPRAVAASMLATAIREAGVKLTFSHSTGEWLIDSADLAGLMLEMPAKSAR